MKALIRTHKQGRLYRLELDIWDGTQDEAAIRTCCIGADLTKEQLHHRETAAQAALLMAGYAVATESRA